MRKIILPIVIFLLIFLTGCIKGNPLLKGEPKNSTQEELITSLYSGKPDLKKEEYLSLQLFEDENYYKQWIENIRIMKIENQDVIKVVRLKSFGNYEILGVYYDRYLEGIDEPLPNVVVLLLAQNEEKWYLVDSINQYSQEDQRIFIDNLNTSLQQIYQMDEFQRIQSQQLAFIEENQKFMEQMRMDMETNNRAQQQAVDMQNQMDQQSADMFNQMNNLPTSP